MLNALIYRYKNGCSWRDLPKEFGNWHVIYVRFFRWAKNGILERVYAVLRTEGLQDADMYTLDSASVKVRPGAFGCLKKRQTVGREVTQRTKHQDSQLYRLLPVPSQLPKIRKSKRASCVSA
jgi:transposase